MKAVVAVSLLAMTSSCSSPRGAATVRDADRSPTARFLRVLQSGGKLFGLRTGCDEWRVAPHASADSRCTRSPCASGELTSEVEDRWIYAFTYVARWGGTSTELAMQSRGSAHPAPGVSIEVPGQPGWGTIGVGAYCTETVAVTSSATNPDAVFIGQETWYLTKESCIRDQATLLAIRGCGTASGKKHDEPGSRTAPSP